MGLPVSSPLPSSAQKGAALAGEDGVSCVLVSDTQDEPPPMDRNPISRYPDVESVLRTFAAGHRVRVFVEHEAEPQRMARIAVLVDSTNDEFQLFEKLADLHVERVAAGRDGIDFHVYGPALHDVLDRYLPERARQEVNLGPSPEPDHPESARPPGRGR